MELKQETVKELQGLVESISGILNEAKSVRKHIIAPKNGKIPLMNLVNQLLPNGDLMDALDFITSGKVSLDGKVARDGDITFAPMDKVVIMINGDSYDVFIYPFDAPLKK